MIEPVEIPRETLVSRAFAHIDYADAYRVRLPAGSPHDVDALTRAFFTATPGWVGALMALRDRIVGLIGLKTSQRGGRSRADVVFQPGASLGIFRVLARTADEILLGEDDRHLDFRASMLLQRELNIDWMVVSTVVRFNSRLGRAYFAPVRPIHRLIIPAMLRSAIRK
jgi:hypothetical protein